jgi:uncharacterized membrane protein YhfC
MVVLTIIIIISYLVSGNSFLSFFEEQGKHPYWRHFFQRQSWITTSLSWALSSRTITSVTVLVALYIPVLLIFVIDAFSRDDITPVGTELFSMSLQDHKR